MQTKDMAKVFAAVLAALLVAAVFVVGIQSLNGPSADDCYEQQIASDASGGQIDVEDACE